MDLPDVLKDRYTFEFLALLETGPKMENDFRSIRDSYYQNHGTVMAMVDSGLLEIVGDEKKRGTVYQLTERGRKVLEGLRMMVDAIMY